MDQLLKFDPIEVGLIIAGFIATWALMKRDVSWHTEWIKKHSTECDQRDEKTVAILTALEKTNAHLVTLTDSHHERIGRIETQMDRKVLR